MARLFEHAYPIGPLPAGDTWLSPVMDTLHVPGLRRLVAWRSTFDSGATPAQLAILVCAADGSPLAQAPAGANAVAWSAMQYDSCAAALHVGRYYRIRVTAGSQAFPAWAMAWLVGIDH